MERMTWGLTLTQLKYLRAGQLVFRQLTEVPGCRSLVTRAVSLDGLDIARFTASPQISGCSVGTVSRIRCGEWANFLPDGDCFRVTHSAPSGYRSRNSHTANAQAGGGPAFWKRKSEFQVYGKPDPPWFRIHQVAAPKEKQKCKEAAQGAPCLYIRRTIRFGEFVEHPGTIVVMGDVNRGAHVAADGDVIILGRLLGDAHAGRKGDTDAVILALSMAPNEIRIADQMAIGPDGEIASHPEVASLSKDGMICIRPVSEQRFDKFNVSEEAIPDLVMVGTRRMERMRSSQRLQTSKITQRTRKPAQIAMFTGTYISIVGIALLLFPKRIFGLLFDLQSVAPGWIQVGAVLAVVFGVYYIGTALGDSLGVNGADSFYMSTVVGRMFLFFSFCWLVAVGAISPPLLLIGAVNFVGAMVMLNALQNST